MIFPPWAHRIFWHIILVGYFSIVGHSLAVLFVCFFLLPDSVDEGWGSVGQSLSVLLYTFYLSCLTSPMALNVTCIVRLPLKFYCYREPISVLPLKYMRVGFPGGSEGKASAYNVGDPGSIPGSGRSPGEGNGNPLHYSCLENLMDWETW